MKMFKEIGKYHIELLEEISDIDCKIYSIYREGDFYDCIIEADGTFELVSNYHREKWVFEEVVKFIRASFGNLSS